MEIELFASAVSRHELHGVPWCSFLLFSSASTPPSTHRIKEREKGRTSGARRPGGVQRPGDWRDECRQGAGVPSSREDGAGKSNCVCPGPLPSFYLSLSLFSHVRTADGVASRRRCPCAAQALVRAARSASAPGAPAPSLSRAVRMCDHDTRRLHAAVHQFRPVPCVGVTPPGKARRAALSKQGARACPGRGSIASMRPRLWCFLQVLQSGAPRHSVRSSGGTPGCADPPRQPRALLNPARAQAILAGHQRAFDGHGKICAVTRRAEPLIIHHSRAGDVGHVASSRPHTPCMQGAAHASHAGGLSGKDVPQLRWRDRPTLHWWNG